MSLVDFRITRRLRGIHAAWHFWYAVSFGDESGLRKVGLGGIHPLTQRYITTVITGRVYGYHDQV
ncbi:DUF3265 domain-containing protein [Vibrio vulnificus]|nr:DUF3265 domain-containing protein [Vibrio vulnificus]MCG6294308.1 DUF3265 domain-containing protein [Vibrio vulnificus]RZP55053.1 DUF3265 domain-containing protein [Vibrio vulnificus]